MKTIVKLVIAAAILHAVARTGMSAMTYYQLKDASQELLVFGSQASEEELQDEILYRAMELSVPLLPENLIVTRDEVRTIAEASYTEAVELLPSYRYPVTYSFRVEARSLYGSPARKSRVR